MKKLSSLVQIVEKHKSNSTAWHKTFYFNISKVDNRIYFWNDHQVKDHCIDYQNFPSFHRNSDYKIEIIEINDGF